MTIAINSTKHRTPREPQMTATCPFTHVSIDQVNIMNIIMNMIAIYAFIIMR